MYRLNFGIEITLKIQMDQNGNELCTIRKERLMLYQTPFGIDISIDKYNNASGDFMPIFSSYLKTVGIEIPKSENDIYDLSGVHKEGRKITTNDLQLLEPFDKYCIKNNIDLKKLWKLDKVKIDGKYVYKCYNDINTFDSEFEDDDYYNNEYIGGYWNVTRKKNKELIKSSKEEFNKLINSYDDNNTHPL